MEEQIIIKGKFKSNTLFYVFLLLAIIATVIAIIGGISAYSEYRASYSYSKGHIFDGMKYPYTNKNNEPYGFIYFIAECGLNIFSWGGYYWFGIGFYVAALLVAYAFYLKWKYSNCELNVSNLRVWGKTSFGKRVDLPITQISSQSLGKYQSISVATSSGAISFWFVENRDDVFDVVSKLLGELRKGTPPFVPEKGTLSSNADELKQYKSLLDSGIITQEEFDAKKKQILGL